MVPTKITCCRHHGRPSDAGPGGVVPRPQQDAQVSRSEAAARGCYDLMLIEEMETVIFGACLFCSFIDCTSAVFHQLLANLDTCFAKDSSPAPGFSSSRPKGKWKLKK